MTGAHLKVSFNQSFALRCSELGKRVGADGERKSYPQLPYTPAAPHPGDPGLAEPLRYTSS
jgi:hypothetical protein